MSISTTSEATNDRDQRRRLLEMSPARTYGDSYGCCQYVARSPATQCTTSRKTGKGALAFFKTFARHHMHMSGQQYYFPDNTSERGDITHCLPLVCDGMARLSRGITTSFRWSCGRFDDFNSRATTQTATNACRWHKHHFHRNDDKMTAHSCGHVCMT